MNQPALPFFFEPQVFVPAFIAIWLVGAAVMARLAGWASLAAAYPEQRVPQGVTIRFVTGELGPMNLAIKYRNCLRLRVSQQGIGVALMFPFNFRSPAFFVDWTDIDQVEESQLIRTRTVVLRFRGQDQVLRLQGAIGQHVFMAYRGARPSGAD